MSARHRLNPLSRDVRGHWEGVVIRDVNGAWVRFLDRKGDRHEPVGKRKGNKG